MDPSVHRLVFDADADPVLTRVETELSVQGDPPIKMRRLLVFEADTGDFMLRARVANALMTACGHDEWTRLFRPTDTTVGAPPECICDLHARLGVRQPARRTTHLRASRGRALRRRIASRRSRRAARPARRTRLMLVRLPDDRLTSLHPTETPTAIPPGSSARITRSPAIRPGRRPTDAQASAERVLRRVRTPRAIRPSGPSQRRTLVASQHVRQVSAPFGPCRPSVHAPRDGGCRAPERRGRTTGDAKASARGANEPDLNSGPSNARRTLFRLRRSFVRFAE